MLASLSFECHPPIEDSTGRELFEEFYDFSVFRFLYKKISEKSEKAHCYVSR